jgi:hypothetical protein
MAGDTSINSRTRRPPVSYQAVRQRREPEQEFARHKPNGTTPAIDSPQLTEDELKAVSLIVQKRIERGQWQSAIAAIDRLTLIDVPESVPVNPWIAEAIAQAAMIWLRQRSRIAARKAIGAKQFDTDFQAGSASDFQEWRGNIRRAAV